MNRVSVKECAQCSAEISAAAPLDIKIPRMNSESLMANSYWPPLKTPAPHLGLGQNIPNKPVESRGKANGKHAQSQAIARDLGGRDQEDALAIADHRGEILKFTACSIRRNRRRRYERDGGGARGVGRGARDRA